MVRIWLKDAREKRGETMKTLADKLNISESYYCSIENGSRQKKMDVSLVSKLSVALGVPIVEIVAYETASSDEQFENVGALAEPRPPEGVRV